MLWQHHLYNSLGGRGRPPDQKIHHRWLPYWRRLSPGKQGTNIYVLQKLCRIFLICWRDSQCSSCLLCQNTCATPVALVQIMHQTSGRTDSRTVWGGDSRSAGAFTKTFFFTSGFKNVTVLNPRLEVPSEDETRLQQWGPDPGAPSAGGIHQICYWRIWTSLGRRRASVSQMVRSRLQRGRSLRRPGPGGLSRGNRGQLSSWVTVAGEDRAKDGEEANGPRKGKRVAVTGTSVLTRERLGRRGLRKNFFVI